MIMERWILVAIIIISLLLVWKLIPKDKMRDACLLFLSLQMITWPAGLLVVEMEWINYPIQLFPNVNEYNQSSFFFEFFLFPIISTFFSLYHPKRIGFSLLYYVCFTGFFTSLEALLEHTTKLVDYHQWKWYWTFVSVNIALFLNHRYYLWFKKDLKKVVNHE
ncbi:hypothetical protein F9279_21380 [Bacillus sp. B1-b2]|nr:hypothetical protein F9279_21380 [Bacillus sp. B1-b2]